MESIFRFCCAWLRHSCSILCGLRHDLRVFSARFSRVFDIACTYYVFAVCTCTTYRRQTIIGVYQVGPWYTLVFGSLPLTAAMDARIRPSTTCTAYSSSLYSVLSTRFPRFFDVFRFRCRTRSMYHLQQTSNGCGNLQISYVAHVPLTAVTCVRPSLACTR